MKTLNSLPMQDNLAVLDLIFSVFPCPSGFLLKGKILKMERVPLSFPHLCQGHIFL